MKKILIVTLLFCQLAISQIRLVSWNVANLGKSKSEEELLFIANTIKNYDIVALQEVVAGYGGAQAVAQLAATLNQKGAQWEYRVSDPTSSSAYKTERYAYLWKTNKAKLVGKPWLEQKFHLEIDREPYFATFSIQGKHLTIANFHAITKSKQPEREIKYFKFLPSQYPLQQLLFAGDFNCPQSHTVFIPLQRMGYQPVFRKQKTSLKQSCVSGNCLASEFDNFFYPTTKIKMLQSGIVPFYEKFSDLKAARNISDHVPIWCSFQML